MAGIKKKFSMGRKLWATNFSFTWCDYEIDPAGHGHVSKYLSHTPLSFSCSPRVNNVLFTHTPPPCWFVLQIFFTYKWTVSQDVIVE
jgi:hypothetical protein